jgi:hypothetical protein
MKIVAAAAAAALDQEKHHHTVLGIYACLLLKEFALLQVHPSSPTFLIAKRLQLPSKNTPHVSVAWRQRQYEGVQSSVFDIDLTYPVLYLFKMSKV